MSTTLVTKRKTASMKLLELKYNLSIDEILKRDYLDNKMSIDEMAAKYDISNCTIHKWLILYDIPRRKLTFI
jgi:hypothetical protein